MTQDFAAPPVRPGLTLVELLVVLTILAVMTTVAIQATDGIIDQGRYDATRVGLERIRDAIIGPADAADGRGGFVADMGRPPDFASTRFELLNNLGILPLYSYHAIDTDGDSAADGQLGGGWRGPYLRVPPTTADLLDGWGRQLLLQNDGLGNIELRSLGRDGIYASADDLVLLIAAADYLASVNFEICDAPTSSEDDDIPDLEAGDVLHLYVHRVLPGGLVNPAPPIHVQFTSASTGFTHQLTNVPMGPIAARAVWRQSGASSSTPPHKISPTAYLTVAPRANLVKKLYLRQTSP